MKNKTKLKKTLNKDEQPFLTHSKSQTTDSKEIYQGTSESETADSGRSMVEMLGVLAVVGVLSVGGILGYKYAMNKYQANQIVNELNLTSSQMAIMLMRPHTADFEMSLGEPYDDGHITTNALAFDFGCGTGAAGEDANCATDDIEYFSEVQGVSKEVCQNLVQMARNLPYLEEVLVNEATDTTGALCAENNTVRCLFNADQNAVIDDNPDPEVTETETVTDDGLECSGHGRLQPDGYCICDNGWYDSTNGSPYYLNALGLYPQDCALSQTAASKKFCNDNGEWMGCGCYCDNGTLDTSNNNCRNNGGCCKKGEISTIETMTLTPEISDSFTPEVTVSNGLYCGEHGKVIAELCYCDEGWYDSNGSHNGYSSLGGVKNCNLSQAEANERFCNNNGVWDGDARHIHCICNDGTIGGYYKCSEEGGCCKDVPEISVSYTPEVSGNGSNSCGEHTYSDQYGRCFCEKGWFSLYNEDAMGNSGCPISQTRANEIFCNNKGIYIEQDNAGRIGVCICNNGTYAHYCESSGNCCK